MTAKHMVSGVAIACALFMVGCEAKVPTLVPAQAPVSQHEFEPTAAATANCQPFDELASLDGRKPVPLQPMMAWHQKQNMMQHLVAIQGITDALGREDWEAVARSSALIETSPQMTQMCQHMGAGAAGFTETALDFHRRAEAIGVAARAHDGAAVLRAMSDTLQACTGCHATFRQDVVDAATWQERTGQVHDPTMMHGEP